MYPGLKLPPEKIISQLISQNPSVTLLSEVLVDKGKDECENAASDMEQDLMCPESPEMSWDQFEINKDGRKRMLCLNKDVTLGQKTTGGSSYSEEECKIDPNLPQCCQDSIPGNKGDECITYGANRLSFSLDDSALQEKLFELYCDWKKRHDTQPNNCK